MSSCTHSSFFLVLLFLILLQIPSSLANLYDDCSSKQFECGQISAGFPFWGQGRPRGCGIPELELRCEGNGVVKTVLNRVEYIVLDINPSDELVTIARKDILEQGIPCPPQPLNSTFDPNIFEYAPGYTNITFIYGCVASSEAGGGGVPVAGLPFTCQINGAVSPTGYVELGDVGPGTCYRSIFLPVSETGLGSLIVNLDAFESTLKRGFEMKWKVDSGACGMCTESKGACGYDLIYNQTTCYCPNQSGGGSNSKTCSSSSSPSQTPTSIPESKSKTPLGIGLGIAGLAVIGGLVGGCFVIIKRKRKSLVATYFKRRELSSVVGMIKWRKNSKYDVNIEAFLSNHSSHTPQRYSYSEVKRMTNSFTTKLGQGGFGSVYKGKLLDGRLVAVKMLDKAKADGQEFINEVASISRTNHINVVTMLGFCYDGRYRALIYEFMPNGSLDKLIFHRGVDRNKRSTHQLEWKVLFEIAVGIAKGLEYLHAGCNIRIVHFDIKPHNILLDEDFCPKISDFGLTKLRNRNESIVSLTGAKGTIGYIAPEIIFRSYGGVSSKSDVYSYGIMILEMVGGRTREIDDEGCYNSSEIYFPDQFYEYFKLEDFSTIYGVLTNDEENVARKMILVGLWCIQTNPSSRPSMVKVVDMLEGSLESLQIPPKPYLYPPTILIQENSTMASSTRYTESQMDEQMISVM